MGNIVIASGAIISILILAILLLTNEVRKSDRALGGMETTIALQEQAALHKEEMANAIAVVQAAGQNIRSALEVTLKETEDELFKQSLTAARDANDLPIEFGDTLFRDLIRFDCLWSLGPNQSDHSARAACDREAQLADPSRAGISVSVITPQFRIGWVAACDSWKTIGTSKASIEEDPDGDLSYSFEDWNDDFPGFDSALCSQTVVAFTPEFSYFLRKLLQNGETWSTRVVNFAIENRNLLDVLTSLPNRANSNIEAPVQ